MVLNQDLSAVIKTFPSLLVPEMPYEISGIVENVVFPTGALVNHEELFVYYGAADSSCCLATMPIDQLLP